MKISELNGMNCVEFPANSMVVYDAETQTVKIALSEFSNISDFVDKECYYKQDLDDLFEDRPDILEDHPMLAEEPYYNAIIDKYANYRLEANTEWTSCLDMAVKDVIREIESKEKTSIERD